MGSLLGRLVGPLFGIVGPSGEHGRPSRPPAGSRSVFQGRKRPKEVEQPHSPSHMYHRPGSERSGLSTSLGELRAELKSPIHQFQPFLEVECRQLKGQNQY